MSMGGMKTPMPQMGGGAGSLVEFIQEFVQAANFSNQIVISLNSAFDFTKYEKLIAHFSLKQDFHTYAGVLQLFFNSVTTGYYSQITHNVNGVVSGSEYNNWAYAIVGNQDTVARPEELILEIWKHTDGSLFARTTWFRGTEVFTNAGIYKTGIATITSIHLSHEQDNYWDAGSSIRVYGMKKQ